MGIKVTSSTLVSLGGEFLLVQEGLDPQGRFNLPGGGAKKRETWLEAAMRETREESGLTVQANRLIGIYQNPRTEARNNLTRFVFGAQVVGGELQTSKKHPTVDFFSYKMIKEMHEAGQLSSLAVLLAIKDFRKGRYVDLETFTELPKVKRKFLLPKPASSQELAEHEA